MDVGRTFDSADADWHDITLFDGSTAQYPQWFHPVAMPDGGWRSYAPDGTEIAMRLKAEFGKDITFWGGGADTRKVLNHGTPQEVNDDVRRRLDISTARKNAVSTMDALTLAFSGFPFAPGATTS